MIYRQISKSGDAPWIVCVQRQLVGGAVVTKEVLRSEEAPEESELSDAFRAYAAQPYSPSYSWRAEAKSKDFVADLLEQSE